MGYTTYRGTSTFTPEDRQYAKHQWHVAIEPEPLTEMPMVEPWTILLVAWGFLILGVAGFCWLAAEMCKYLF